MKIRGLFAIFVGNVLAFLLIVVAGFLTVRFTSWGNWAVDSSRISSAELAARHGDPVALLEKGVFIHQWVFGPVMAMAVGGLAAIVFRRTNWLVSTLSVAVLVLVLSAPTSPLRILSACSYVLASWLAMKLVSSRLRPVNPGAVP